MNNEEIKNKQELKAPQESGETSSIQETPEALSQKMTEQSQKEVSDFQTEGEKESGILKKI